ncbi:MAG: response regulator transcription factor [Crocinitomicaceae bacterium]|nr:response regulator transcription factor [Crocinitomicaceae bacterium]
MNKITAILVDDEGRASSALSALLALVCSDVEILEICKDVPSAVLAINRTKPNLVFLDVEMPEYNGFELFGFFREIDFQVVFVTAYSEYAIRAFEVSAVDYLMKPVDPELLKTAVQKVRNNLHKNDIYQRLEILQQSFKGNPLTRIAVPSSDGTHLIPLTEILYLQAEGAYTTIFKTDQTKMLVSKKLKHFENALEDTPFMFRPHRSYLINLYHVSKFNKGDHELTLDNGAVIPIARDRKHDFETAIQHIHRSLEN